MPIHVFGVLILGRFYRHLASLFVDALDIVASRIECGFRDFHLAMLRYIRAVLLNLWRNFVGGHFVAGKGEEGRKEEGK